MTVLTNTRRREHPGNGTARHFSGPRVFSKAQLEAHLIDQVTAEVTTLVLDVDYEVRRVGFQETEVELFVAPAVGETLLLLRTLPSQQPYSIKSQGAFFADIHEDAFDYRTMVDQQMEDQLALSIRFADTVIADAVDPVLPAPVPLGLLGWNSDRNGLVNYPPDVFVAGAIAGVTYQFPVLGGQTEISVSSILSPWMPNDVFYNGIHQSPSAWSKVGNNIVFSEALPADGTIVVRAVFAGPGQLNESEAVVYTPTLPGSITRSQRDKNNERISVKDFGAKGDGVTNDTAALQAAINSGASELFWPAGHYVTTATLKPVNNQSWIGVAGETMIKHGAAAPTNAHVIAHNTDGLDGPLTNFSMAGFIVDGNHKEGGLVLFGCNGLRVKDCIFQNCETYGMGLQARPGYTIDEPQDDIVLTRCQFNDNGFGTVWDGLDIKYCTNAVLEACSATDNTDAGINVRGANVDLIGCQAVGNGTAGILLQSNYTAGVHSRMRVIGGQAYGTVTGPGLELQGDSGNTTYVEISAFQSWGNGGVGTRISGTGKVTGNITALQSRGNASHGVQVTGDYSDSLVLNGGLIANNVGDGFRTAGKGAVLSGVVILNNTGAGYREDAGADNNYLMPTCVVSGNGSNVAARVGAETSAGFIAARSAVSMRMFPGQASGLNLETDSGGTHSSLVAVGDAAAVGLRLISKGNGDIELWNNSGTRQLALFREAGSLIVNYHDFIASLSGSPVIHQAVGTDTNIDLQLTPKGTGRVRFGTLTANADAPVTGYITIKDAGGTERKLAVIA